MAKNIVIEGASIGFKNFSGREIPPYNPAGRRQFCVFLDPEIAKDLEKEGWNIKYLKEDEDGIRQAFLSVRVNYGNISPRIFMVTRRNKVFLDENTIGMLDDADITNVDIVIRPYTWNVGNKEGIAAYVKTMYVTIEEDEFASKYEDNFDDDDEVPFD